jgi:hypothetical protein
MKLSRGKCNRDNTSCPRHIGNSDHNCTLDCSRSCPIILALAVHRKCNQGCTSKSQCMDNSDHTRIQPNNHTWLFEHSNSRKLPFLEVKWILNISLLTVWVNNSWESMFMVVKNEASENWTDDFWEWIWLVSVFDLKREICYRAMTVMYSESPDQKSDGLIGRGFVLKKLNSQFLNLKICFCQRWML